MMAKDSAEAFCRREAIRLGECLEVCSCKKGYCKQAVKLIASLIVETQMKERLACADIAHEHYKRRDDSYAEAAVNIAHDILSRPDDSSYEEK